MDARRRAKPSTTKELPPWPLSAGEINFFYWFIQDSIMNPGTRRHLRRSWGFCERHAWAHLAVETAFRHRFLLGPAILYEDLIGRSAEAFSPPATGLALLLARRLSPKGPCLMCEMKADRAGPGLVASERVRQGQSTVELCAFALETRARWLSTACGICRGDGNPRRCRPHLVADIRAGRGPDLRACRQELVALRQHLGTFLRSFVWGYRGIDGPDDRAAIFCAAGWLSGWRPLLVLTEQGSAARP